MSAVDRARDLFPRWVAARAGGVPLEQVTLVETHVSVLAFCGDRAYKLKKPVHFDFLDLHTPKQREADCRREVELNRRMAPDVYLGVVDLVDEDGQVLDHVIEMRRMPEDRRLAALVGGGADVTSCLDGVAALVAELHAGAPTGSDIDRAASVACVADLWEHGFAETRQFVGTVLDGARADRVEHLVRRYLAGRGPLFEARVAAGRSRDGHGDLLADDIFCLPDGPRVLDCLEFDDRLRWGDVLADVAFLAMDLERLGRVDLGRSFLDEYRRRSGDRWPASLEDFYVAYRAHVRAKVACLRHAQGDRGAAAAAAALFGLSLAHLEHGRVRLVLTGGLPGTGKTTLAESLGARGGWVVLRSDLVRKELAGVAAADHSRAGDYGEGLYSPAWTERTYAELLDRARRLLVAGETVVLDASWSDAGLRRRSAAVAAEASADLVALRCRAPVDVAASRMARRGPSDASDATESVAGEMAGRFDAWPEATIIDTDRAPEAAVAEALAAATGADGPETG